MKIKLVLVLFFSLLSTVLFCQKKMVDVLLVNTKGDTIRSKMSIYPNLFSKSQVDERSFFKTVVLLDSLNNSKTKIKAKDISSLTFIDFKDQRRLYLNNGNTLQRFMYDGQVKWYRTITQNLYDGSLMYHERFITESGESLNVTFNLKKRLKELTKSKPELAAEIDQIRVDDEAILAILKKYESH